MLNIIECEDHIETDLTGKYLMTVPQLNKSTAFTREERKIFGLEGKLPARIETLSEQVNRAYLQFSRYQTDLQKHIYLNNLHDKNQILFYQLITENLTEMVPLIYTPCIGAAVQEYSHEFRQARGLFISYEDKDNIETIFDNRTNTNIDLIVVTDGEGVLGIGDQGVGSINIPIAKLMIYSLFAGISPLRTLPVYLDTGTNNPALLNDKFYLGNRHPRLSQEEYDEFIAAFVKAVQKKFPLAFLHWEDFGRENASRILTAYQEKCCTFNDDIQGTGAVALSAILAGIKKSGLSLEDQRIIIFGAGTAGVGIAEQIYRALLKQGLTPEEAQQKFWLIDREGLITCYSKNLTPGQLFFARKDFPPNTEPVSLLNVIERIKPNILIGCSSRAGAFTEEIIKKMAGFTSYPLIFPLSNPTDHVEALPQDIIRWTDGRALVATGSPFEPVNYNNKFYPIAQCNNALVYPGIGLGILASRSRLLTDDMLYIAAQALSEFCNDTALLPSLAHCHKATLAIAKAIMKEAVKQKLARINLPDNLDSYLEKIIWKPQYLPLKYKQF